MANGIDVLLNFVVNSANSIQNLNKLQGAVLGVATAVTTAGAAFAKVSLDAAVKFESAMQRVASVTLESKETIKQMAEEVKTLTNQSMTAFASEAATALYDIRSAGIAAADAMQTMQDVLKAASGTGANQADVARALTGVMNAYGVSVVNSTKAADIFVKTIQDGVTTGAELAGSLGNVTSIAAAAGVSIEELGASVAVMTQGGIQTSEAMTSLKAIISSIIKPASETQKLLTDMGIKFDSNAIKTKGLVGIMQELYDKTGGNVDTLAKLIPSVEALNGVLVLSKDGASKFANELDRMNKSAGASVESADKVADSWEGATKRIKIGFDLLKIEVGTGLKDAFLPFLNTLGEMLKTFNSLDPQVKQAYINIGKLIVGLSALTLGMAALNVATTTFLGLSLGAAIVQLTSWVAVATSSFTMFASVMVFKVAPAILAVMPHVAALGLAIAAAMKALEQLNLAAENDKSITDATNSYDKAIHSVNNMKKATAGLTDFSKLSNKEMLSLAANLSVVAAGFENGSKAQKKYFDIAKGLREKARANIKAGVDPNMVKVGVPEMAKSVFLPPAAPPIKETNKGVNEYLNKIKQSQDEIARLRKDAADQEARLTKSDLEYKMYSIQQERAEKEKIIKEAISLGTASDKDLIQLRKNTTAELLKVWKEYSDKITAEQKEAAEKAQKEDQDYYDFTQDALNDIEKIRLDKLEKRRQKEEEILKAEQEAQDKYYTTITAAVSRYTGEALSSFTRLFDMQKKFRDGVLTDGDIYAAAIDTIGNSISIAFDAFDKLNQKIKEGTANTKDFWNYTLELIRAVPGVGEALSGLIGKIGSFFGGGNTDEQNKTLVNAMNTINKLILDVKDKKEKQNEELKKIEAKYEDAILDKKRDVINRAYELEKDTINKTYEARKELARQEINDYEKQISRLKSDIEKIDDELARRAQKQAASKETSAAFAAQRKSTAAGLSADFYRSPVDVFEIENQSAIADLQNKFNIGDISQDQLNKELMGLAVKRNIFYQHVADSLQKGTKENLEWQKKANSAYTDYAELQQESTEEKLRADREIYESQMSGFESLKQTQLSDIAEIEAAHQNAIINLDRAWKTPAGAFRLSMEEALIAVAGKMDTVFKDFVERSKTLITNLQGQKQMSQGISNFGGGAGAIGGTAGASTASGLSAIKIPIPLPGGQTMWVEPFKKTSGSGSVLGSNVGRPNFGGLPGFADGGIMNASGSGSPAILHGSEMILNPFQQANLFNMINAGAAGGGGINVVVNTGAINTPADLKSLAVMVGNEVKKAVNRKY